MTTTITADATTKSVTRSETVTLGEWVKRDRLVDGMPERLWSNKSLAIRIWRDLGWTAHQPEWADGRGNVIAHGVSATIEQAKKHADAALNKWLEQMSAGSFARLAARTQRDGQTADVVRAK